MGKTYIADKETLDKCYAILSADGIYGFIEHMDVLSPTARIEYIGQNKDFTPISLNKDTGTMTLNSWADFPIIVANKPWMVRADGTPDYRLDENDYTKKEDGTASDVSNTSYNGGAFSWLAKIYKQEYMLGNDRVVKFSMRERDGFEPVGFKDPSNNVLEGVWIPMFYGSILGADTSTHSGIAGPDNTVKTMQNFIGEDINYYARVNFTSLVTMVDALGGIDVYSDKTINGFWTDRSVNIKEGMNHMNGKEALAFSRERHAYAEGDNHRVQNQQDVLMAMLKKMMSPAVITNYSSVLKAISGCFETNMASSDITDLIKMQINDNASWTFKQKQFTGTGVMQTGGAYMPDSKLYYMIPNDDSVKENLQAIKDVLNGK